MLQVSCIIPKNELLNLIEDTRFSKIEVSKTYSKTLRNQDIMRAYFYFKFTKPQWVDTCGMIKMCKLASQNMYLARLNPTKEYMRDMSYLASMQSVLTDRFIKKSQLEELIRIATFRKLNLSIPKWIKKMIKQEIYPENIHGKYRR